MLKDLLQKDFSTALFLRGFIRLLVLIALGGFVLNGNWIDAVLTTMILFSMSLPAFLGTKYKFSLPPQFDLAITAFIFLTLFLGSLNNYYEKFEWWDAMLHTFSGVLLGLIGFLMVYVLNQSNKKLSMSAGFVAFFSFIFSLALAALWEVYEYMADTFFGYNMQLGSLSDTMLDIIVNIIGALIVSYLGYLWIKKRNRLPFMPVE